VLGGAALGGLGLVGLRCALPRWLRPGPVRTVDELSNAARALVDEAFADLDRAAVWDVHAHLVGLGAGGTWVNPRMRSHLYPVERLRFDVYLAASGVTATDPERAGEQYLARLLALGRAANPDGKLVLLAFDYNCDEDGEVRRAASPFHTPNELVLRVAREHPEVLACASVHPYRPDALARLDAAAEAGAIAVKWLPNAMGIDPADARCDAFYARMIERGLVLLTHTGLEQAVHAEEAQRLGNPLRLRRPLDAGVRVVAAHCASTGVDLDLDRPEHERAERESFDLLMRLMHEPRYEGRLFGEISALTLVNRRGRPLVELLKAEALHPRLVNGSDYPLPAIDPMISTRVLVHDGLLDAEERAPLNELFEANPLLFDLVLKRRLRVLEGGRAYRFLPIVFESARVFAP